jgi:hypothetical protein
MDADSDKPQEKGQQPLPVLEYQTPPPLSPPRPAIIVLGGHVLSIVCAWFSVSLWLPGHATVAALALNVLGLVSGGIVLRRSKLLGGLGVVLNAAVLGVILWWLWEVDM